MPLYRVSTVVVARSPTDALNAAVAHNRWEVHREGGRVQLCPVCQENPAPDGKVYCAGCSDALGLEVAGV